VLCRQCGEIRIKQLGDGCVSSGHGADVENGGDGIEGKGLRVGEKVVEFLVVEWRRTVAHLI